MKGKLFYLNAVLILSVLGVFAQEIGADARYEISKTYQWDDVSIFRINKEPARAFFVLGESLEDALKPISIDGVGAIYSARPYRLMNGGWRFFYFEKPSDVHPEFFEPNFDASKWESVGLPDTWQTRGVGKIYYTNILADFSFDESGKYFKEFEDVKSANPSEGVLRPRIPELHRCGGLYRKDFYLDDFSADKAYIFRVGAAKSGVKIFVNGKFAGYSEDSFTPTEFDISAFLKKGKNTVVLQVFKFTTGSYTEIQDMPHVMGVIRDVVLAERPKIRVADIVSDAVLDGENFKYAAKLFVKSDVPAAGNVSAELYFTDSKGKVVKTASADVRNLEADFNLSFKKGEVFAWSADKPNLYQAVFVLKRGGQILETAKIDAGFRTFYLDEKLRLVWNGSPLKIKGVNRHNYAPEKGSAVDFQTLKSDLLLIKNFNINAIRTSHYPNPEEFYMLCNRLGIFVLDENNLESHSLWNHVPGDSGTYDAQCVDRMQNMVKRDRNQPCVFGWSLGNENANHYTPAHKKMEAVAKKYAPAPALVHCEPATYSAGNTSSFHSPMYGGLNAINRYLSEPRKKPFMFCEYCFAVGNAIGNLEDIWQKMRSEPALLGGFIWEFADLSLWYPPTAPASERFLADGRDFGTPHNAGIWCASGVFDALRNITPKSLEVQRVYQDIQMQPVSPDNLTLKISNEFLDTNLSELSGRVSVYLNGEKIASKPVKIDLPAGESAEFKIDLPRFDSKKSGEYFYGLEFTKPGFNGAPVKNVSKRRFLIKKAVKPVDVSSNVLVSAEKADGKITMQSGRLELVFDEASAKLESVKAGGEVKISKPFELDIKCAWLTNFGQAARAFRANKMDELKSSGGEISLKKLSPRAARVLTKEIFSNDDGGGFILECAYTLSGGVLEVSAKISKINETPEKLYLPRVGLRAFMPESAAREVSYLGLGPAMNYPDKLMAADFGKWKYFVKDEIIPYAKPQDCGNRCGVEVFEVAGEKSPSIVFASVGGGLNFSLLPNSQEEILAAKHFFNLPKSEVCELRIAPLVSGVGNGALGPETLEKYKPYFKGSVEFKFLVFASSGKKGVEDFYGAALGGKASHSFPHESENVKIPSLVKKMEGDWISKDAKIEYSSLSKEYHPAGGNPLKCAGENFAFHTERDDEVQYAVVDLSRAFKLSGMVLYNRKDAQGNRTNALRVYLSDDGKKWRGVWQSDAAKEYWRVFFPENTSARFVKIELRKKEYFHLSGIKIIGREK